MSTLLNTITDNLVDPRGVAILDTTLYVANRDNNTVVTYDANTGLNINTNFITNNLSGPIGLAIRGTTLYIANQFNNKVVTYDAITGQYINLNFISGLAKPYGIAIRGNTLYIANGDNRTVGSYDATTGDPINANFITGLSLPVGLTNSGNTLYVSCASSGKVGTYDATTGGTLNDSFISGLALPTGIAISGSTMYVINSGNGTVGIYDVTTGGQINANFITGLTRPYGITINSNNNYLWITNHDNHAYQYNLYNPSCFNEGTKILSLTKDLEEKYVPIETLKKGDLVKTYKHGYRKIELIGKGTMQNNPNSDKFNECMYKMAKTDTNGLTEDLIVTEGHAILVDDLGDAMKQNRRILGGLHKIDDKFLLLAAVSKDFVKLEGNDTYTYYHLALENDGNNDARYGIWANGGVLTETVSVNQFNERKYTLL